PATPVNMPSPQFSPKATSDAPIPAQPAPTAEQGTDQNIPAKTPETPANMQTAQLLPKRSNVAQITTPTSDAQAPAANSPPTTPLPQKLLFPLENSTPDAIERYFTTLRETLAQITQELVGRETPDVSRVMQEVRTLESQMDFASQIRNQIFVQVPLYHDGRETPLSLHIYKDAKKSGGGGGKTSSALIALDTASLGHFETYVQKNSRAVQCQFRLENDEIAKLVRENIHTLDALLSERGYNLEHFSFLPPGEPYSIINNPSASHEQHDHADETAHFDKKV
ncbi:MAG: flagellar hook-length control protein FliK, partial [Defluviitaleaceae bacterium]|nr:flagellar hook-length control protein FliK [Defluviitaleaceae bacterium]